MILEFDSDQIETLTLEPYAYESRVRKGDVFEIEFLPEEESDTIQIAGTTFILFCYEPILTKNGCVEIDLSLPTVSDVENRK